MITVSAGRHRQGVTMSPLSPFIYVFCLCCDVGTRVPLQQQNELSHKDFVFVNRGGWGGREKRDRDFQSNLIAVIQIHYKESMLPLFSENGGALMCLCESALFSRLQGGN